MRALVLEDFGRMAVQERSMPRPAGDEVLIKIVATGICGSDIHGYTGENGRRVPGQVMGHETVGIVAECGPDVGSTDFAPGDVVTFNPVVVPGDDVARYAGCEQRCPNKYVIGVAHDVVAAFAQYRHRAGPKRGAAAQRHAGRARRADRTDRGRGARGPAGRRGPERPAVLILGGGPIGQSVVLAARMEGATDIVVSEIDPGRRALCERLGAKVIDPATGPVADQVRQIFGDLASVALDAVGIEQTVAAALESVRLGGVGVPGRHGRTAVASWTRFVSAPREVAWSAASPTRRRTSVTPRSGSSSGPAEVGELISRQVRLEDGPQAFADLARGDGTAGKVLVRMDTTRTGELT